jgi:RNA polymerase sigma-70 factor (ECF subfamily)
MILDAGGPGPAHHAAMEQFARAYWYPVYAFIRRKGSAHEAAEDLTQSFFAQMLEKNWLAGVERRETRFSTLLLSILNNFLISEHRHATREKRGSGQSVLSLDMAAADDWFGAEPLTEETPERIFERRFALSVLAGGLDAMKAALHAAGRGRQFDLLSPYLSREPDQGEYSAAAETLGISNNAVAATVLRLRREYRQFVREEVAAGLSDSTRVDEELRHLAQALEL